jgi:hypothetical protein
MNIPEKIKELEAINESHRKLNGELRERIKELEALIPIKEEARKLLIVMQDYENETDNPDDNIPAWWKRIRVNLQKIAGGK